MTAPDFHREFPQAPDAEKGVLASCLIQPSCLDLLAEDGFAPEAFYIPAHRLLFEAMSDLWNAAKPLDFITLAQHLKDRNQLDQIGGPAALNEMFFYLPTAASLAHYRDIVLNKLMARKVIETCNEFAERGYAETAQIATVLDEFEERALSLRPADAEAAPTMKESVMKAVGDIQHLYENRGKTSGIGTGFTALDRLTDGLHGGEMFVIAARPSMGKTALAMNMAEHIAVELGLPVAVFSLEMSRAQLVQRMVCSRARVNLTNVRNGFLSAHDFPAITVAASALAAAKMIIDDGSSLPIQTLRARARRMKQRHGVRVVFVDYLQLLRSSSRKADNSRQVEVSEISAGLKAMAKELNLPVVVLAQLNRDPEKREKGRPRLSDLRESGSIEQDADVVGLLQREEYYAEGAEEKAAAEGKATLVIAKQRNGPVDDVPLTFMKEITRFENCAFTQP